MLLPNNISMRFSVPLFPYDRWGGIDNIRSAVCLADRLGFYGVTIPDHIVMPVKEGKDPIATVWYDNFVLASHLASVTEQIRMVFHVLVLPYRSALHTAKMASTLDQISNGRVVLGVGTGWMKAEFRALEVPFENRGIRSDETLEAMVRCWTDERPRIEGDYVNFDKLAFEPKCVQSPHIPLWVGGSGTRALARAARFGAGWCPMDGNLEQLRQGAQELLEMLETNGRAQEDFAFSHSISVGAPDAPVSKARGHATGDGAQLELAQDPEAIANLVASYKEVEFNHLGLSFDWKSPAEYHDKLEWFASAVMPLCS